MNVLFLMHQTLSSFSVWIHEAVGTLITMALFAGCVPDTVHVYALVWKCIEFSFWIIPLF